MKKSILVALIAFIATCAWCNKIIFESGFESNLNIDWSAASGNGMSVFEIKALAKNTGSNGLHMFFSGSSQKGNLTTPKNINWEAGTTYLISFWYKTITPSDNDDTNIKFFSSDGTKIHQININSWASSNWTKYTAEFKPNVNNSDGYVLFSFRPNNAGNAQYYLDDFAIENVIVEPNFFNDLKTKNVESDPNIVWQQFGPGMSGNNKSAFWHPTDPDVLFIGPNMGNSYGTWDKGKTYHSILNEDETDFRRGYRGPIELTSLDFSRQDADFGMCTDERNQGIYYTENRGRKWTRLPVTTFDNKYVNAITVDPKNDDIWYAGGGRLRNLGSNLYPHSKPKGTLAHAGSLNKIWKSTDKGQTWVLKNNGLDAETGIETLLVDPKNSDIVYASTSTGFYKSTNGGNLWVKKNSGMDYDMLRAMDYHYNETNDVLTFIVISNPMWKATGNTITDDKGGLFRSKDRGESWEKITGNLAIDMSQFQSNNDVKKSYYHCAAYVFDMSDDDFKATYPVLPSKITIRFNTVEIDPENVNNIYLNNEYSNASRNNFKPGQLWRSTDGGENWHVCLRNGKAWKVNSTDASYWAGRNNPMGTNISLKYKKEWVNRDFYERKGCNFVKFNCDGSALHTQMAKISLMSYNKGVDWVDIDDELASEGGDSYVGAGNSNVPGHGFYQHPLIPHKVFCHAGENSLWITNNEGDNVRSGAQACTYNQLLHEEVSLSWYAVHPNDTNTHYALFFRQAKKGKFMRSTDYGKTWSEHGVAVPHWDIASHSGDQSVHQIHLTIDPVNPDNMYFVVPKSSRNLEYVGNSVTAFGVHKTSDGGKTWKEANVGLPDSKDATMICLDPNDSNTLYVSIQNENGGLFKSTDNGENWEEVISTEAISGTQGINDVHFAEDGKVYITSGTKYGNINDGGVWVSNNGMQNWERIFDYPWTNRIETAMYDANTILISTLPNTKINGKNGGTYLSRDGGKTWLKINKGNGQSDRINDIAIDNYVPGKFYASTYGSGWYTATDANSNSTVKATDISINEQDITIKEEATQTLSTTISPFNASIQHYTWFSGDESIATIDSKGVVRGVKAGNTTITARLVGTNITATIQVTVEADDVAISKVSYHDLMVFPNPTQDWIQLASESTHLSSATINIFSVSGKKVLSQQLNQHALGSIPVAHLPNGYYLLVFTNSERSMLTNFVKN